MPYLKTLLFTIVVPGSVTALLPWLVLRTAGHDSLNRVVGPAWLGLAPLALGVALYLRCAWDFASFGRGTPAPVDPPKELVVVGLYRFTRNPMYVAILSILFGEALLFRSLALAGYAALCFAGFHAWIVAFEEPQLRRLFGGEYAAFCARVPRWLGPPRRPA